jgi:methylenetetrahydrofolate dehydrogenase (NADP+)/methenyltetrahydrofolate cyclohydrolase
MPARADISARGESARTDANEQAVCGAAAVAARIIDGKAIAERHQQALQPRISDFTRAAGRPPALAAVLVGDNPASQIYVRNKEKACAAAGLTSRLCALSAAASQDELLRLIAKLNADVAIDGILVQLPLPPQLNESAVIAALDPLKDVDGFHPENMGRLALGQPRFVPCTPLGVWELLKATNTPLTGRHVVILGRSNIVGKPLALLLVQKRPDANATVTLCHSHSRNWRELLGQADVVIAAVGQPRLVTADLLRPDAVVIDVGINRLPDGKLAGDVDFAGAAAKVAAITPVPGGVGPMTIAMLLANTVLAAEQRRSPSQT